ncbi:MAG: hypothetical protein AB7N71_04415, partial [Phycisphaerae bacterium]
MTLRDRRNAALFPLATMLAIVPTVWLTATASAEERKLAILLAYPVKQDAGTAGQAGLPNTNDIFDAYFDKFKNGQNGGPRVDSHAEWWEEISYGDVTVSGNVYGWVNLPWRTLPENPGDLGGSAVPVGQADHINLIGGTSGYLAAQGEFFDNGTSKYRYDFDGRGGAANGRFGNFSSTTGNNSDFRQPGGAKATDAFSLPVFTPGERFLDLNGNRIYDAGTYEWGIDKNGNGYIDVDKQAASWFELVGGCMQYERDEMGEPFIDDPNCMNPPCPQIPNPDYLPELELGFLGWNSDAEWYDSNGDGHWNLDKRWQLLDAQMNPIPDINPMTMQPQISQEVWNGSIPADPTQDNSGRPFSEFWPSFAAPPGASGDVPLCDPAEVTGPADVLLVRVIRGDWGGTEIWMDNNGDFAVGERASQDERYRGEGGTNDSQPAALFEFVLQFLDPESDATEYYDEQFNDTYDFPEPFEDFLVRWDADAHQYVEVDEDYIRANYPGDEASMTRLLGDEATGQLGRIGNHRYDAPDTWSNNGNVNSTNKLQQFTAEPVDGALRAEWNRRNQLSTPSPDSFGPNGWSFEDFWDERFGTDAPMWESAIPLFVRWNPNNALPPATVEPERMVRFAASAGGENGDGTDADGSQYREGAGTVVPTLTDGRDGMYDGPAEYADLPSSIYHSAGDGYFGEITGPGGNDYFGSDVGGHDPNDGSGTPDRVIPAAGPLAFNVHGDQGWDGGNVFNTELLTWQTGGAATDDVLLIPGPDDDGDGIPDDNDMDGQPDFFPFVEYHRDINLDGMIDLGETVGESDEFGIPGQTVLHSYGLSPISGQPANGNPSNAYPHNRTRAMEDTVEALDDVVDWDDFLGGAGAFGNSVYGVLLMPAGTGPGGMFTLPASVGPGGFFIRTRDRLDPNEVGINRYVPISFFDGMGIEIGGLGEGGGIAPSNFQVGFAGHEYGHIWEGWPDLYDYDVRLPPPLNIVNNPVGAWCVMAGGGLVHPVPILKADSGWINPIDVTRALNPGLPGTIQLRPWEFDRNRTVYRFSNPLFGGEEYWFWATHPTAQTDANKLTFDRFLPGNGLMIMRTDRGSNNEGLPPQQRIADGRFTYQI